MAGAPSQPLLLIAPLALTGLVFSTVGVITGAWAETFDQHACIANLIITPLALLGGVFYAAQRLHEPWHTLTQIDPLYYLTDATRYGYAAIHEASLTAALLIALAIEALNRQLRKAIKTKGSFPTEDAARKLIYLAICNAVPQWTRTRGWTKALLEFKIHSGDRIPD